MPLVSAIIPVFNRTELLLRAVRSVLSQTHRDLELIIVDDGSNEPVSQALPGALPVIDIIYLRHDTNRGSAAARNTGVAHAKGQYVAFLDSDDEWRPDKIERQLTFMRQHPGCQASCTGFVLIDGQLVQTTRRPPARTGLDDLLWGCRISPGSTLMVERSLFELTGLHDETLRRLEDWDWLLRAARHTPIMGLAEVLAISSHDRYAHVDNRQVLEAARKMARYTREGRYGLSRAQRMILLSALEYELAAMSYRKGHYGAALRATAISLAYCPWKGPSHVLAATLKALGKNARCAIGLERTPKSHSTQ